MVVLIFVLASGLMLSTLVVFPWVGLAILPVAVAAALALLAWLVVVLTREPPALPRHEPEETAPSGRPESGERRGTRAGPSA